MARAQSPEKVYRNTSTPEGRAFWALPKIPRYTEEITPQEPPPGWKAWPSSMYGIAGSDATIYSLTKTEGSLQRAHKHARRLAEPYIKEFAREILACGTMHEMRKLLQEKLG